MKPGAMQSLLVAAVAAVLFVVIGIAFSPERLDDPIGVAIGALSYLVVFFIVFHGLNLILSRHG